MSQDESRFCTTDAVHPRLKKREPLRPFHCLPCNEYFPKGSLEAHFTDETKEHQPIRDKCSYCEGNVYEYMHDTIMKFYHKCPVAPNDVPLSTSSSPSLTSLASSTSVTFSSQGYGSMSSRAGSTALSAIESEANNVDTDV